MANLEDSLEAGLQSDTAAILVNTTNAAHRQVQLRLAYDLHLAA
jgi:hypothetical protein